MEPALLSATEIGLTQKQFNCFSIENIRNSFADEVAPALYSVAIPYLNQFQTVADIIPAIRHASFLGFALHAVGRYEEAREALLREQSRLHRIDRGHPDIATLLAEIERVLASIGTSAAAH